jgi:hypothetical protein
MFNDMAVPDEQTRIIEPGLDPCDFCRISDDRVFETRFPVFGGRLLLRSNSWRSTTKLHLVDMDRMSIFGEVVALPDLDGVQGRVLRNWIVPAHMQGISICVNCAEQGCPWPTPSKTNPCRGKNEKLCMAQAGAGRSDRVRRMGTEWSPEALEACRVESRY